MAAVAANHMMTRTELIKTLCEIANTVQGDAMELGAMDSRE